MLKRIEIKKLFGQFDYDIALTEEGVTIITGPNGYGKTTILKIINAAAYKDILYFYSLNFECISFFDNEKKVRIEKNNKTISISLQSYGMKEHGASSSLDIVEKQIQETVEKAGPFRRIDKDKWIDMRNDAIVDIRSLILDNEISIPFQVKFREYLSHFSEVYLIQEQRLLRQIARKPRRRFGPVSDEDERKEYGEAIREYADELKKKIADIQAKSSVISRELDGSFPQRLLKAKDEIAEDDFNRRYKRIIEQQNLLSKYKLSPKVSSIDAYQTDSAKVLKVYLDDIEQKLNVFNDILGRMELFSNILNKRLTFKQIELNPEDGFKFLTNNNLTLDLRSLSSGEQQEVVMLYELLFKVEPQTLVLIDEPEISLHVVWQKEFLKDLLEIVKARDITAILATHSPQIINDRWDLTVDLEENSKNA